jgi:hypothetical protein
VKTWEEAIPGVDPALAVDHALTVPERARFRRVLVGGFAGARPADWIDEADNNDAHLDRVEPWLSLWDRDVTPTLADDYQIPEEYARRLVVCALYANLAMTGTQQVPRKEPVQQLAYRAAAWVLAWVEGSYQAAPPHDPIDVAPGQPVVVVHHLTTGLAGTGNGNARACHLPTGTYPIVDLDGTAERGEVYIEGPDGGALVRINPNDTNLTVVRTVTTGS